LKKIIILAIASLSLVLISFGLDPAKALKETTPKCTIVGTVANDVLTGTKGNDVICGLGGDDLIDGGLGNDIIYGGPGNDKIIGGDGSDKILGESGNDTLVGGGQPDVINGGPGDDQILGGSGNDTLTGDTQNDFIRGEAGDDKISGGLGKNMISGGLGKDVISANQGTDTCAWDSTDLVTGSCRFDKTSPVITPIGSTSLRFQAGTTAVFTWKATDTSGVEESWLSIGGASGWVTKWCDFIVKSQLVGGNSKNGIFEAKCDIPQTAPNLSYSVFLSSRDYMGNISSSTEGIIFEVFGGSTDTDAPTFEYVSGPASVAAGKNFEIVWHSTDVTDVAYSGIYFAYNGYSFSDGFVSYVNATGPLVKVSGNDKDCVFTQTFTVSPDAPAADYTLWSTRSDSLGNKVFDKTNILIQVTR